MPTLLDFTPDNPWRPLDWRQKQINQLLAEGLALSRRRDDEWVARGYRYQKQIKHAKTAVALRNLKEIDPATYWAYDLIRQRDEGGPHRLKAYMLEARLLSGQPWVEIAMRLGCPESVVEAYHQYFFECLPRRLNTDFLMAEVVGEIAYRGLRDRNYDIIWKLFAIHGGQYAVDAAISTFTDPTVPTSPSGMKAFFSNAIRTKLAQKAALAAHTIEVNNFTAAQIIDLFFKFEDLEARSGDTGASGKEMVDALGDVLLRLPFAVGCTPSEHFERTPTRVDNRLTYDQSAVELTGDELLLLGAGHEIHVESRPFPPSPQQQSTEQSA